MKRTIRIDIDVRTRLYELLAFEEGNAILKRLPHNATHADLRRLVEEDQHRIDSLAAEDAAEQ